MIPNPLDLIGNTPLVKLRRFSPPNGAQILAKLEWYNIGGSIKDRVVKHLIECSEREGTLTKDKIILEATSGNTGIALAMIGNIKGYKTTVIMPESVSLERKKIIKTLGANLLLSPPEKGMAGAIKWKETLLKRHPDKYIDLNQFCSLDNVATHYSTTAKEIIEQTNGKLDVFIAGVGTAGTAVGVVKRLKEHNPKIETIAVTIQKGINIRGLKDNAQLFMPELFDEIITIGQNDLTLIKSTIKRVARLEGLIVGPSSATVLHITHKKARTLTPDKTILTILPDSGLKYLSTEFY